MENFSKETQHIKNSQIKILEIKKLCDIGIEEFFPRAYWTAGHSGGNNQ